MTWTSRGTQRAEPLLCRLGWSSHVGKVSHISSLWVFEPKTLFTWAWGQGPGSLYQHAKGVCKGKDKKMQLRTQFLWTWGFSPDSSLPAEGFWVGVTLSCVHFFGQSTKPVGQEWWSSTLGTQQLTGMWSSYRKGMAMKNCKNTVIYYVKAL